MFHHAATRPTTDDLPAGISLGGLFPRAEVSERHRSLQPAVRTKEWLIATAQEQGLVDSHVERSRMRGLIDNPNQTREHQLSPTETGSTGYARTCVPGRTSFDGRKLMFTRLIWVIDETPHPAALNMAIDEALLLGGSDQPLFRTYRWLQRSVSLGYFSSWEQAAKRYSGREIVRRWTGGGMVEHGDDFTYSLLLPISSSPPANRDLYRAVHTDIDQILASNGRAAAVVNGSQLSTGPSFLGSCFERSVENDVEVDGVKVAGAAIRRLRTGVILQGSIPQISIAPEFPPRVAQKLVEAVEKTTLSTVTTLLAQRIANEKYGTESWTRRY